MPTQTVNLDKVEKQLAELLAIVKPGSEIVLAQNGKPIGRLASIAGTNISRAENGTRSDRVRKLKALFKKTQSLPKIRNLTEDEILSEIEDYRAGR